MSQWSYETCDGCNVHFDTMFRKGALAQARLYIQQDPFRAKEWDLCSDCLVNLLKKEWAAPWHPNQS